MFRSRWSHSWRKKIVSAPILNCSKVFAIQIRSGQNVRCRYNGEDTRASFNITMHPRRRVIEFAKLYKARRQFILLYYRITTKLLSFWSKRWHVHKHNKVTNSIGFKLKSPIRLHRWLVPIRDTILLLYLTNIAYTVQLGLIATGI